MIAPLILTLLATQPMPVLLIVADDIGWDLHTTSPHPNLDALAAQGRTFENFWAAPVCSNSRARLYTGQESWRYSNLMGGNLEPGGYALPLGSWLLPGQVASSGRTAVLYGKLHVSEDEAWPLNAGFERWFGTLLNLGAGPGGGFWDWVSYDGIGSPVPQTDYATRVICDAAMLDLVGNEPDLMVLTLHEAHRPYNLPPNELAPISYAYGVPSTDIEIARAKVEALDTCAGPIINAALARGYVVLYCSDNGTSELLGGGKDTMYESGINVPLIVAGPNVQQGTDTALVQMTDLHQTILHLLGIDGPPQADSVSFARRLTGVAVSGREFVRADRWEPNGTNPDPAAWARAVRDYEWKLIDNGAGAVPRYELYDLWSDPDEATNLYPPGTVTAQDAFDRLQAELPG